MNDDEMSAGNLLAWLESIELGQYHQSMADQDINLETIVELDDSDLQELGVSIGHRKKLRRAIEDLKTAEYAAPEEEEQAQRRQLTVLFCDLAESTKMARRYDAEDLAEILHSYHTRCYQIIESWGGRPLGTQGDGVIACFGLPQAQENDAERCLRAALEMSEAIKDMTFRDGLKLQSRIGIATGRMYVRGAVEEPGNVVGDTLNLASRLQDFAEMNSVVLSSTTQRLVEKVAHLEVIGDRPLKGFAEPVRIWAAKGMVDISDRLDAHDEKLQGGLVGREKEVQTLQKLWNDAKTGKGNVAIISGEAGIGKSYVLDAVRNIVADDDHIHIRYFSAPFYENSAMFPVIAQLSHAADIKDSDTAEEKLTKIRALFPGDQPKDLSLIAELLSVDTSDALPPLDMTAAQQKLETFAVLQRQLLSFAKDQPVLILAEDAHWADPTSLEFLTTIVSQVVPENRILLVITHRPPLDLGWGEQDHLTYLTLERLTRDQSREIVRRILGEKAYPLEVVHDIIDNADGVPLFVEELARSAAEQMDEDGFRKVTLPSSLEDSLRGRLDRLSLGKRVVQTAAVFGRRFYVSLLRPMLALDEQKLGLAISEPIDANIIFPVDDTNSETMLFRHALVQQAAYQGLLKTQRKELHATIADLLLEHRPGIAETEPETLARHYAGSGQLGEAIKYLTAAGQRATSRAGQIEATNHYLAALDLLKELPESKERDGQEVFLQALLGGALMATRGFAAPDVYDAFARARDLCLSLGDNPMYCSCLYGLFTVNASRSNKDEAVALAQEMLDGFGDSPVTSWAIAAHFAFGVASFFQGNMDLAETHFDKAVDLYTDDQHAPLVEQFGDNLVEFSMCYLQWLHLQKGQIALSGDYLDRAEKMANDLNNKNAQTRTFAFRMGRLQELRDLEAVSKIAPDVISISMAQGYPYWATTGQIGLGWALSSSGHEEGIQMIREGLGFFDLIGQKMPQTYWRSYLISGLLKQGEREEALGEIETALDLSRSGLDSFYEAALLRLKGLAYLLEPAQPDLAEDFLRQGLETSKRDALHLHVLQSAVSLAEFLDSQGRAEDMKDELAVAISNIETTEDFAELLRAKALLKKLSG